VSLDIALAEPRVPERRLAAAGPDSVDDRVQRVPIGSLRPADSPRTREDPGHVHALAESEAVFDPIVVRRSTMRVIDGMHRLRAAVVRGEDEIPVRFFDGTEADAFALAVELNIRHGLLLSLAERKTAAGRIVGSHPHWSDRVIALRTGLSAKTIAAVRGRPTAEKPQSADRVGRDGRIRPVNGAEGRRRTADLFAADPRASVREIARQAGVAPGTARDVRDRLRRGESATPARKRPTAADVHPAAPPAARIRPNPDGGVRELAAYQPVADPALRSTDTGRQLLQMLHVTVVDAAQWEHIASTVPVHSIPAVRRAALERAEMWRMFAELIAQR
jgi:ParB-like chromosome segregation protein Spo0J